MILLSEPHFSWSPCSRHIPGMRSYTFHLDTNSLCSLGRNKTPQRSGTRCFPLWETIKTNLLLDVIFICSLLPHLRDLLLLLAELLLVHLGLFCQPADSKSRGGGVAMRGGFAVGRWWQRVVPSNRKPEPAAFHTLGRKEKQRGGGRARTVCDGHLSQSRPSILIRARRVSDWGDLVRSSPTGWKDTHLNKTQPTHHSSALPPLAAVPLDSSLEWNDTLLPLHTHYMLNQNVMGRGPTATTCNHRVSTANASLNNRSSANIKTTTRTMNPRTIRQKTSNELHWHRLQWKTSQLKVLLATFCFIVMAPPKNTPTQFFLEINWSPIYSLIRTKSGGKWASFPWLLVKMGESTLINFDYLSITGQMEVNLLNRFCSWLA